MPRVNRDIQRRMAARRERERRRPAPDRRYSFGTASSGLPVEDELAESAASSSASTAAAGSTGSTPKDRTIRRMTVVPSSAASATHPTTTPFSTYRAEYAYVLRDLQRVAVVIGSLLVILILLYFVLPR